MTTSNRKGAQGFTLIEALVGTGVFTIGVAGSVGLLAWIIQATATNGRIVGATAAGQAQMEKLFDDGYANVAGGTGSEGQYDLAWTVNSSNRYRQLSVDVKWTNLDGRESKISLESMIASDVTVAILPGFVKSGNGGSGGVPIGGSGVEVEAEETGE